jgi:hypothetical protein
MAKKVRTELNVEKMSVKRGDVEFNLTLDPTNPVFAKLALHGFAQKMIDATAGKTDAKGWSEEDRLGAMNGVCEMLNSGVWSKKKESKHVKIDKSKLETLTPEQRKLLEGLGLF